MPSQCTATEIHLAGAAPGLGLAGVNMCIQYISMNTSEYPALH